jgi:tRNA threonylcarbamoyladenosine biosynthesis protein TsaE
MAAMNASHQDAGGTAPAGAGNPTGSGAPTNSWFLPDAAATAALGAELAALLPPGTTLLLHGDLGSGKTTLVQGLAAALGITEAVTSPTFALAQHYTGQALDNSPTALVHLDLYRLEDPASADELFAQEEEEAAALGALLVVEWAERLSGPPQPCWRLSLEHQGEGRRALLTTPEED